jgi:competence protein ComEC
MACALIYIGLAGPIPSLSRAAATEALIAGAALGGRVLDPIQALAVSAMALLAWAPGWSFDVGFQLSCAATLGLVTIGRAFEPPEGLLAPVLRSVLVTTSAQIVALPLLLASFHAVSWIAPLSNLAAVPTAGLLLTTSWVAIVCDIAVPGSGALWFRASEALGLALRAIAETAARLPGAGWSAGHEPIAVVLAGVGALLLAIASAPPRAVDERARPASRARVGAALFGGCASAIAFVMALAPPALAPPPGRWWLVALDVGQGDAIALGFPMAGG